MKSRCDRENKPSWSVRSLRNKVIRVDPDPMYQQMPAIVDEDSAQIQMLDGGHVPIGLSNGTGRLLALVIVESGGSKMRTLAP